MGFRDLEDKLKSLVSITDEIAEEAALEIDNIVKAEFNNAEFAPLKPSSITRRKHNKPPLVDTEKLKDSIKVQTISYRGQVDIRITLDWYQVFHQATGRTLIQNTDKIKEAVSNAAQKVFNKR